MWFIRGIRVNGITTMERKNWTEWFYPCVIDWIGVWTERIFFISFVAWNRLTFHKAFLIRYFFACHRKRIDDTNWYSLKTTSFFYIRANFKIIILTYYYECKATKHGIIIIWLLSYSFVLVVFSFQRIKWNVWKQKEIIYFHHWNNKRTIWIVFG